MGWAAGVKAIRAGVATMPAYTGNNSLEVLATYPTIAGIAGTRVGLAASNNWITGYSSTPRVQVKQINDTSVRLGASWDSKDHVIDNVKVAWLVMVV